MFVCVEVLQPNQPNGVMLSAVSLPNHMFTRGHPRAFREGEVLRQFQDFREKFFVQILDFPIHSIHFHFSLSSR